VHYIDSGSPPGGPTLVLLHPFGGSLRFWDETRRRLGDRYRIIAYDRAGSGQTPAPTTPQTKARSIAELDDLLERHRLRRIVPIGVAIGAMIAAAYTAAHPQRVAALIFCNPALKVSPAGRAMTQERLARLRSGGIAALLPDAVDLAFNGVRRDAAYRTYLEHFRANDAYGYELSALATLDLDITDDLPRIQGPTLVLTGEHDVLFPPANAAEVARLIPESSLLTIRDAAHFPPIQNPSAFAQAVKDFLESAFAKPTR
jgi:3-oxoadipate enol-lactonase